MRIGFIGTGNMGAALARACKGKAELLLCNRSVEKAEALAAELGGRVVDAAGAAASDFLFLGVKPNQAEAVLGALRPVLERERPVLVSMLAGVTIAELQSFAGGSSLGERLLQELTGAVAADSQEFADAPLPVIRIMPNIPVAVGQGLVLYERSENVTAAQEAAFLEVLSGAGVLSRLEERKIDAGSALSGCGPAFVALFAEALADGGVACGLPRSQANAYAAQTLLGTAAYLIETGLHPGQLKDAVCSPGGTTIQGVRKLEQSGLRSAVMEAVIAAWEKTIG